MIKTNVEKYDVFKTYYWQNAKLCGLYNFPELKQTQSIPYNVISFTDRKGIKDPENHWVDFFIDDYKFENFWNSPQKSFSNLRKFAGIISVDYSMYPEMPLAQRIWNCSRNRVMTYYLQENGFNVIPVASWCNEEDFEWCFDGLPEFSSIAVSNNGCLSNTYSKNMFIKGVCELQKRKKPYKIIVCGRHMRELDVYDNIIYYNSFSQRLAERLKNGR